MPLSPKDEIFCQGVASGLSKSEAYRRATGKKGNPDVQSAQLMVKNGIKERIAELTAETSTRCSMTRDQLVEDLVQMLHGKPGEASLDNPLCDSLISRGQRHAVFPMKATIAHQLAKICGWERPTEIRVEAGSELTSFLGRLFTGNPTLGGVNGERNKASEAAASVRH
jgi:hypothetical protein